MRVFKQMRSAGRRGDRTIPTQKRQRAAVSTIRELPALRAALQDASRGSDLAAFTLLEVMLAITIFFMAMFAILGVLTSGVRAATLLRNNGPTAGMVIAQLSATNKLEEGSVSGTFQDIPIYKDYRWVSNIREVTTNGLFQVDVVVVDQNGNQSSMLSALLYRPDSGNGQMGLHQR